MPQKHQGRCHKLQETRFLADENIPRSLVVLLRKNGADVKWILEEAPGIPDDIVLEIAVKEQRVLITLDVDFAARIFKGIEKPPGLILVRVSPSNPKMLANTTFQAIINQKEIQGKFIIISDPFKTRVLKL